MCTCVRRVHQVHEHTARFLTMFVRVVARSAVAEKPKVYHSGDCPLSTPPRADDVTASAAPDLIKDIPAAQQQKARSDSACACANDASNSPRSHEAVPTNAQLDRNSDTTSSNIKRNTPLTSDDSHSTADDTSRDVTCSQSQQSTADVKPPSVGGADRAQSASAISSQTAADVTANDAAGACAQPADTSLNDSLQSDRSQLSCEPTGRSQTTRKLTDTPRATAGCEFTNKAMFSLSLDDSVSPKPEIDAGDAAVAGSDARTLTRSQTASEAGDTTPHTADNFPLVTSLTQSSQSATDNKGTGTCTITKSYLLLALHLHTCMYGCVDYLSCTRTYTCT